MIMMRTRTAARKGKVKHKSWNGRMRTMLATVIIAAVAAVDAVVDTVQKQEFAHNTQTHRKATIKAKLCYSRIRIGQSTAFTKFGLRWTFLFVHIIFSPQSVPILCPPSVSSADKDAAPYFIVIPEKKHLNSCWNPLHLLMRNKRAGDNGAGFRRGVAIVYFSIKNFAPATQSCWWRLGRARNLRDS